MLFGMMLVAWPGAGALAVLWLIGAYTIAFGVVLMALGLTLARLGHATDRDSRRGLAALDTDAACADAGRAGFTSKSLVKLLALANHVR